MAMITEDYVSFETAKLLKEKGFDEKCFQYWDEEDNRLIHSQSMHPLRNISNPCFFGPVAPTLQMTMKWLREVHKIFIEISVSIDLNGEYHYSYSILNRECKYVRKGYTDFDWNYEQAAEAAIKHCVEHLI